MSVRSSVPWHQKVFPTAERKMATKVQKRESILLRKMALTRAVLGFSHSQKYFRVTLVLICSVFFSYSLWLILLQPDYANNYNLFQSYCKNGKVMTISNMPCQFSSGSVKSNLFFAISQSAVHHWFRNKASIFFGILFLLKKTVP